ncbi:MAG: S41 family peptidase [bacterium]|nr:S41 family peptidase [bacterium]MDA1292495.1 S41 family peptidase [bacterium]
MKRFSRILSATLLFVLLAPVASFAASADDALPGYGDSVVISRGDFIRAAVQVLEMENMSVDETIDLPYRRVARGLEKYIRIAHTKDALEAFRYDLLLAQDITRGDALRVLVNLSGKTTTTPASFKDVRIGSEEEYAVRVAIDQKWMEPIRNDLFGVRRKLTGREAILLLRKASGETMMPSTTNNTNGNSTTIKVNYTSQQRLMNLPKTQILESIWSMIEREFYYTDNIDVDEAAFGAAEGLVKSLGDKYTTFMRPVRAQQFQTQIKGEVTGIGAQVEYIDEIFTIISPIKGSPAEAAGLKPGDQVIKVDGVPLAGLSFMDAVDKVRGPKGSKVKLTIRRDGIELDFDVLRDIIRVPEDIITWQGDIAVVQITQFGRVTQEGLRPQMEEIVKKNPKGIVLDLRSNPGGLLSAANLVVSLFVPKGTPYVEVRSRKDQSLSLTTQEQVVPDSIPVVVLANEGSASASEIVAGALQDLDRATVVGAKTFGKGTVQQVLEFNDQSSLKMTIAEWFTPNGGKIDGIGVHPDIGISEIEGRDAPLLKALDLLR